MKKIFSFFITLFCPFYLNAATEFEQLKEALKSGDFATVQQLVPKPFDIKKTTIDGKNLKEYAVALRKLYDDASNYDQIAYYLGAENANLSTPFMVFIKKNFNKISIAACFAAIGLYAAKKEYDKRKNQEEPNSPGTLTSPPIKGNNGPTHTISSKYTYPNETAALIAKHFDNKDCPYDKKRSLYLDLSNCQGHEHAKNIAINIYKLNISKLNLNSNNDNANQPPAAVHSALYNAEKKKKMSKLQGLGSWCEGNIHGVEHLYRDFLQNPDDKLVPLYFYEKNDAFYQFANFALYPITLDGKTWPTSEHYFQGQKYIDQPILMEQIRLNPNPRYAFSMKDNHPVSSSITTQWHKGLSDKVMEKAIHAKFTQHQDLHDLLLATGDAVLVENAGAKDSNWGAGANGNGANKLGLALMKLRHELRTK